MTTFTRRTAYGLDAPRGMHWTERAACLGETVHTESLISRRLDLATKAVSMCAGCPVLAQCTRDVDRLVSQGLPPWDQVVAGQVWADGRRASVRSCARCGLLRYAHVELCPCQPARLARQKAGVR